MSNTVIQIKRSLTNSQPPSLNVAELAYSYASNTFFIGTPDGTGTIAVGGKAYLDLQNSIYALTNSAYVVANANYVSTNANWVVTNSAFGVVNAAYTSTNANYVLTNSVYTQANTDNVRLSGAYVSLNANYVLTNSVYTQANTDNVRLSGAYVSLNAAYVVVNSAYTSSNAGYTVANAGFGYANASNTWANATFVKLSLPGQKQTITGDLAITGNLFFTGNATVIETSSLEIGDTLIYLGANNYSGTDLMDIGIVANYGNTTGANVHTGLYRDHVSKEYFLFQGLDVEPSSNLVTTPYTHNMVNAVLNADLITSNLTLGGANAIVWITSAYNNSNGGFGVTNSAFGLTNATYNAVNSAFGVINAAYTMANMNYTVTNAAYTSSNAGFTIANAAYTATNSAFGVINAAYTSVNAAYVVVNAAYTSSNAGFTVANAAFGYANNSNAYAIATFSNAANITSGILPSGRLSGSYTGITGVGTITTGTWNGTTVNVGYGGTGIVSATLNGVVFGSGGNAALQVTAAGTEGQVLTASSTGIPQFSMLSGGTFMYY